MSEEKEEKSTGISSKMKLLCVMVVVFLVCGGNGVGLLAGALVWRSTGRTALAIVLMLAITLVAVALAVCLILALRHIAAQDPPETAAPSDEDRDSPVIPEA